MSTMYPVPEDDSKIKQEQVYPTRSKPAQERYEKSGNDATAMSTNIAARLRNPLSGIPRVRAGTSKDRS